MKKFEVKDFPNIGAVTVSKMVVEENYKPRFIFREKPIDENDSGWLIFSGMESDEYSENPKNFGLYSPKTILEIDNSISEILLYKGIGSVWELGDNSEWEEVFDYPLESDFLIEHKLTEHWNLTINNLFIRKKEEDSALMYTTGDKTLRMLIWNYDNKTKEEIAKEKEKEINEKNNVIERYKIVDKDTIKTGYHIKEYDEQKDLEYNLICGFCLADNEILQTFFYFDDDADIEWALNTWKQITYTKNKTK